MEKMLLSTLSATVTNPLHLDKIKVIDDEDFSSIKEKVRQDLVKEGKEVNDKYLIEGILALKQYYAIALLDPCNMHAISDELDIFWHSHILHTRQYIPFCKKTLGVYIHHIPLNPSETKKVDYADSLYDYTVKVMQTVFTDLSEMFYPRKIRREQLVCTHANDGNGAYDSLEQYSSDILDAALFERKSEYGNMGLFIEKAA